MRLAIVSDIHGNLPALEAVLADLRETAPDLIWHGGDIPHGGSSPAEVLDRVRDLGWPGVAGNTDEMLWRPEALTEFAAATPGFAPLLSPIREMAQATAAALGAERLAWLRSLPSTLVEDSLGLVHAAPASLWVAPGPGAADEELELTYSSLGRRMVVYGHIHDPFVRTVAGTTIANTGSVSLSYDGDPRASYLVIDDDEVTIRRVEYDVEREAGALFAAGFPHPDWMARTLRAARPQMP